MHLGSVHVTAACKTLIKLSPGVDPTKLFFLRIIFFGIKLGYFTINKMFSVCNKNASLTAKNGEILR